MAKLRARLLRLRADLSPAKRPRLAPKPTSVQRLPDEMLAQVFSSLDKNSLLSSRAVCARWNRLAERRLRKLPNPLQVSLDLLKNNVPLTDLCEVIDF